MSSDPHRDVYEALERDGYGPRGPEHDFRARCPAHEGDNGTSLHVTVGGDGRALLHCFAHGCRPEAIVAALGLSMADLFPPGHHKARRRRLPDAGRQDFTGRARTVANVLAALEQLGDEWYLELRCDCAHCGSPAALLQVSSWRIEQLSCPGDEEAAALGYTACTLDQFKQALAGRLEDREFRGFRS